MDRVARLIGARVGAFFGFALLVLALPAHAFDSVPVQQITTYTTNLCGGGAVSGPLGTVLTKKAESYNACGTHDATSGGCPVHVVRSGSFTFTSQANGQWSGSYSGTEVSTGTGTGSCSASNYTRTSDASLPTAILGTYTIAPGCDAGGSLVGTGAQQVCACITGYKASGSTCVQYTCPPSGGYTAVTQPDQLVPNAGDTLCAGGCGYMPSSWKVAQDGRIWATWPFKSTGTFCSGDPKGSNPLVNSGEKNSSSPAPIPCPANQCPGNVNGNQVCVPCSKTAEAGTSTAASAPAGSASGVGDTTTETKTECTGVQCTTTTTTKDGSGTVTGSTMKTEKQETFCQENPQSSLCKQSSISGSCGAPVACEGDAIQCAIAADQIRRNCQWFDDAATTPLKEAGDAAMNGQLQPADHPYTTATSQSVSFGSQLDQLDRLGGGCPVDVSVTVMDKAVSLPFSSMCGPLGMLGNLLVGLTALWCVAIVFK